MKNGQKNIRLSLGMVVKNEALLIGNALSNVRPFVDEIIVVDTGSTDQTVAIAKRMGAKVINYAWDGSLGRARNEYIKHATGNWILVLDGDERIATRDYFKIRRLMCQKQAVGYFLKVKDYSRQVNLLYNWHPNTGQYPYEERFSHCPGSFNYCVMRLFRNSPELRYDEGFSVHVKPSLKSLARYSSQIKYCDVTLHNFQFRKGGQIFVKEKQQLRLNNEINHLKCYPEDVLTYLNIAKTFFLQGCDAKAFYFLNKAQKIDMKEFQIYFLKGMIFAEQGRFNKAIDILKQALKLKPANADARALLGMVYERQEKYNAAEKELKKAIRLHPSHVLAHHTRGLVSLAVKQYFKAEEFFKETISMNPYFIDAYFNLANVYFCTNRRKWAQREYKKILKIDPANKEALQLLNIQK